MKIAALSPGMAALAALLFLSCSKNDPVGHADRPSHLRENFHGGEPVQVTTSKGTELSAQFSPDGKHLAVGKKYSDISYFNLAIVPNDGKVHNMDTDDAVSVVQPNDDNLPAAVSGSYFWVP